MVTYAEEIKVSESSSNTFKIAVNKYHLGLVILEEMQKYWPSSSWAYSLFRFLADSEFSALRKLPRASRWQSPEPTVDDVPSGMQNEGAAGLPVLDFDFLQNVNAILADSSTMDSMLFSDLFDMQNFSIHGTMH